MTECEKEARTRDEGRKLPVLEPNEEHGSPRKGDLVVDLSGIQELDFSSLSVLLTAQQQAKQENRSVWLAGVPLGIWKALDAMGLGRFFIPFPNSGEVSG